MKKIIILLLSVISIMLFSQKEIEANNLIVLNEAVGKLTIEEYKNVELHKNEKCNYLDISYPPNQVHLVSYYIAGAECGVFGWKCHRFS